MSREVSLYDCKNAVLVLKMLLENCPDDVDYVAALAAAEGTFEEKALATVQFCKNLQQTYINDLSEEIRRLTERKNYFADKVDRLYEGVLQGMQETETGKIEFAFVTLQTKTNPPALELADDFKCPQEYKVTKITESVDKKKLKDDIIKNGVEVEGAKIVQRVRLEIK